MHDGIKVLLSVCTVGFLMPFVALGQDDATVEGREAPTELSVPAPEAPATSAGASELAPTLQADPPEAKNPMSPAPSLSSTPSPSSGVVEPTGKQAKADEKKPADSSDISLSRKQMIEIFEGDLSSLPGFKQPKPTSLPGTQYAQTSRSGFGLPPASPANPIMRTTATRSPQDGLAVAVREIEKQIAKQNEALMKEEDENRKEVLLKQLAESYKTRFELDTAYQDYRVTEIEKRARKLRADVESREKATQQWVDAMVTLAKMKSDGIETMNLPPGNYNRVISRSYVPTTTIRAPTPPATFPAPISNGKAPPPPQALQPFIAQ